MSPVECNREEGQDFHDGESAAGNWGSPEPLSAPHLPCGRPADVAETRTFLVSAKSPWVTGTIWDVDGDVRTGHNRYTT